MPSNVEIKARVADLEDLARRAEALADGPVEVIHQEDVFFGAQRGRLKLRTFFSNTGSEDAGELIFYERPDTAGSKRSDYRIVRTAEPQALRETLTLALGELVVVKKRRRLYLVGPTRIHLDEVEGLGTFMELEVVLAPGQDPAEGHAVASELRGRLGIGDADLVATAYADLLLAED